MPQSCAIEQGGLGAQLENPNIKICASVNKSILYTKGIVLNIC